MTSPSVITIKNDAPLLFDEDLFWMMDIEYYKRCYDRYGKPKIIDDINVVSRIGAHQVTHSMATAHIRRKEYLTVVSKYEHGFRLWLYSAADYLRGQAKQVLGLVWKKYAVTKQ